MPVPNNGTTCGLPVALSVMLIVPRMEPVAVGVKVTPIEHDAPALIPVPHVFIWE